MTRLQQLEYRCTCAVLLIAVCVVFADVFVWAAQPAL